MVDELIKRAEVIDTWVKENVGVDTLSQYDEYTKQLAIQTWGQSLKGHHVEDYLEARFRE